MKAAWRLTVCGVNGTRAAATLPPSTTVASSIMAIPPKDFTTSPPVRTLAIESISQ